jgi:predicted metal-dependent phosphoesterase TrpH
MPDLSPTFDLQSHSTCSDGVLEPAAVVAAAARAGVELLALTDHDTVAGVAEALVAGAAHGLRVVPAVEVSALRNSDEDVHVLGYGIAHADPTLLATLADWRADRERRALDIAERLEADGLVLDRTQIDARATAGDPIGRPHLADAVLGHPDNAARLRDEEADDHSGFFERYLVPGGRAYIPRTRPTVAEAIDAIHGAGGVALWAHPFWDVDEPEEVLAVIDEFVALGIDGVECFYPSFDAGQTALLCDRCEALDLLRTGSADFHGPEHPTFSRFRDFQLYGRAPALGPIG